MEYTPNETFFIIETKTACLFTDPTLTLRNDQDLITIFSECS